MNCLIDGASGVTGSDLGRDAANSGNGNYYYGQDAYINCTIDTNVIVPAGWVLGSGTVVANTTDLRFWEFDSVDTNGNPVNTSSRVAWSTEIRKHSDQRYPKCLRLVLWLDANPGPEHHRPAA